MAATETVRELHLFNLTSKVYLGGRQECQEELFEPAGQSHFKTIVHSSQQETLPISEVRQFAQQSDRAGTVGTRWDLVVQALVSGLFCNGSAKYAQLHGRSLAGRMRTAHSAFVRKAGSNYRTLLRIGVQRLSMPSPSAQYAADSVAILRW